MRRRDFLRHTTLSAAVLTGGCNRTNPDPLQPSAKHLIVDAHCHVFNASDLPAARFLRQVVIRDFPKQSAMMKTFEIRDPDVTDRFIELILTLLGTDKAPTAKEEIAFLKGIPKAPARREPAEAREAAITDTANFLVMLDRRRRNIVTMTAPTRRQKRRVAGDEKFLAYMLGSRMEIMRSATEMSFSDARVASREVFTSKGAISRYLNWFSLFRLYRHVLVEKLIADTPGQGFRLAMLAPALVDYDEWLYEDVKSPISEQMEVMSEISVRCVRQKDGPVLHGYIGFDPLREVVFENHKGKVSSLKTVERALSEFGFAGVKLYPPMGFQPSGNRRPYPQRSLDMLGFDPSRQMDEALRKLYALCMKLDAPILAHGYSSNESGNGYAKRGDPHYWTPVFSEFPKLRVCLAHFGRFDAPSQGRENLAFPQRSWEWALGEFMKGHPRHKIYGDISYFSEALSGDAVLRKSLAANFRLWTDLFDPKVDRLIFGTDWLMLGQEKGYEHYVGSVKAFLLSDCGFAEEICDKIFRRNALNFLPLQQRSIGRARLERWYFKNGLAPQRLPLIPENIFAGLFR
ncbi:amidohydrolase family protein [Phyllobacterium endophyticum]|uniref:Amidohydrolase-related domain-containing protein n=1 Tax=Phyllobacterium endophyticum TaxID=1149773 RepID=A0A2P7AKG4_9HYPH|nr:amidohydrolase family protein [Phyllobacterium endophyticum]MBB3237055.1 putative TIM-barrel fold metal-dependent hydrolase [Phyllobacterium endophyticum]PSH54697.1 hypothetical protein CU100_26385 [Phyllobacterium endophyticum]TYR40536.1 amidohydrolase [Phyllobacterium endophyticum]